MHPVEEIESAKAFYCVDLMFLANDVSYVLFLDTKPDKYMLYGK